MNLFSLAAIVIWSVLLCWPIPAPALAPGDLIIVYYRNLPESKALARYYTAKRRVPLDNLLAVNVPTSESISQPASSLRHPPAGGRSVVLPLVQPGPGISHP